MKKTFIGFLLVALLGLSPSAQATLWDRGGGLIYDDGLEITWLQNANLAATNNFGVSGIIPETNGPNGLMNWDTANNWIAAMNTAVYLGYSNWRLPTTVDGPYVWGYDGTTTAGYNITTSEIGYMYYVNLGNLGYEAIDGSNREPGYYGLTNTSFTDGNGNLVYFQNLRNTSYWSGTEFSSDLLYAWYVHLDLGYQRYFVKTGYHFAWAVRDGDVPDTRPVPEPATMLLLASGLVGLAGYRKLRKR